MSEHRIALISGAADPIGRTIWAELPTAQFRHNNEGSLDLEKGYPGGLRFLLSIRYFLLLSKVTIRCPYVHPKGRAEIRSFKSLMLTFSQ